MVFFSCNASNATLALNAPVNVRFSLLIFSGFGVKFSIFVLTFSSLNFGEHYTTPTTTSKLTFNVIDSVGHPIASVAYSDTNHGYYLIASTSFLFDSRDSTFVYAGGIYSSGTDYSGLLMKFNMNGDTIWSKVYNKDSVLLFNGLILENDGYLLYGISCEQESIGDSYLAKTDFNGNIIWEKVIHMTEKTGGADIVHKTFDNGYIIATHFQWESGANFGDLDNMFQKTDSLGNVQWTKIYGTPNVDNSADIIQTKDSNYVYSTGYVERTGLNLNTFSRTSLTKLDQSGNLMWQKKYCDTSFDNNNRTVKELSDGNLVTIGYYVSAYPVFWPYVSYILKTKATGDSIWYHTYMQDSLSLNSFFYDIESTIDNGFVICGSADAPVDQQYWIIKTDSMGCYNSTCKFEDVTRVNEIKESETITIYPNPATNEIMLTTNQQLKTIHIYNVLGEEVLKLERIANSQKAIDISTWNAGVYFVEVETEKGIVRKKVVKE